MPLAVELEYVPGFVVPDTIDRFRDHIDPVWIEEALAATGTATVRKRRLPAEQVLWLVIGMALLRNESIERVVSGAKTARRRSGGVSVCGDRGGVGDGECGRHDTGELTLADEVWEELPDDSLLIGDRNFLVAHVLHAVTTAGQNRHWLTRAKSQTRLRTHQEAIRSRTPDGVPRVRFVT